MVKALFRRIFQACQNIIIDDITDEANKLNETDNCQAIFSGFIFTIILSLLLEFYL